MATEPKAQTDGAIAARSDSGPATSGGSWSSTSRFSFGDAESVLNRREFLSYAQCWQNGRWYSPPMPMTALAQCMDMAPMHKSAILYKRNQLIRHFEPSRFLSIAEFGKFAVNFLGMGNGYLERRDNIAGRMMTLKNAPAIHTRRGTDADVYWWVPGDRAETSFRPGYVFHLIEDDLRQELYGIPEWSSALQSGLLNESATVFRRRYYENGSHAGYILYVNDERFDQADSEQLDEAIAQSKGPGNFRNLYLHIPGGREKGVQVIPVGEQGAKDLFTDIKSTTAEDLLAAHRVPPPLIAIVPKNTGGFGDVAKAADVFHFAEIEPLMLRMQAVNEWAGDEVLKFRPYERQAVAGA